MKGHGVRPLIPQSLILMAALQSPGLKPPLLAHQTPILASNPHSCLSFPEGPCCSQLWARQCFRLSWEVGVGLQKPAWVWRALRDTPWRPFTLLCPVVVQQTLTTQQPPFVSSENIPTEAGCGPSLTSQDSWCGVRATGKEMRTGMLRPEGGEGRDNRTVRAQR